MAFSSDRSGAHQIWAINADGTGARQLTFSGVHGASTPVIAPDGSRLAYLQRGDEGQTTCVIDLNHSWHEQSPESLPPIPSFRGHFSPSDWSADGENLIGTFIHEDGNEEGIGTFSFTSKTYQKVLDSGSSPSWLKDNRRFIFIQKGTIYLGDTLSRKAQPVFSPSSYVIQQPVIASDQKTIYFRFLQVEADVWSLSLE